ncbi:MAG: PKD domain-containing protein [Bacteroidota bacterium]|nr:PKD domain-containing protein [Bacteroidota bacterium]
MKTQYENSLKEKLNHFEPKGAQSQWSSLEKQLPKKGLSVLQKGLIFAGVVFVATLAFVFFVDKTETEKTKTEIVADNTIDNQDKLVEQNTHAPENAQQENITSESLDNQTSTELPKTLTQNQNTESNQNTEQNDLAEQIDEAVEDTEAENTQETENSEPLVVEDETTYNSGNENSRQEKMLQISQDKKAGCVPLTINFSCNANPENYEFMWHFKDGSKSTDAAPSHVFTELGEYTPVLILNPKQDGLLRQRIVGSMINAYGIPEAKIDFDKSENLYTFNTINRGDIVYCWKVDKQSFNTSLLQYEFKYDGVYAVELKMVDQNGCESRLEKDVNVKIEHYYAMPNAFTPDVSGMNAYFGPVYDDMLDLKFTMIILDKFNQVIYQTDEIDKLWDGMNIRTNQKAEAGVYLWKIVTEDQYGNVRTRRGQVTLLRN